jgi:hypothetical protein
MNTTRRLALRSLPVLLGLARSFMPSTGVLAADVSVLGYTLSDKGDLHAYADANETVNLQITVRNGSGSPLTGVTAMLETDAPGIECLIQHAIYVGDLAAGETRLVTAPFVFKVADVNRTDPYENLRATLRVELPDGFTDAACIESGDGSDTQAMDADPIAPGAVYYYLVVATNQCGRGCAGYDSEEDEREVCACP